MKFADVTNDVAFRKIFGNENRTETLISFLNSVLSFEGDNRVMSVQILNPYQLPNLRGGKVSILDVRATDQRGQQFIVEMQVAEEAGFGKRVLYYASKSYSSQIVQAEQYRDLKPTYFIGILGEFSHTKNPHYISRSRIQDVETGEVTIQDVEFNFIELEKFNKKLEEVVTLTDKWIYFIKHSKELLVIPENIDDLGLKAAYEEANKYTWEKEELFQYDVIGMRTAQLRAQFDFAMEKAQQKITEEFNKKMAQAEQQKAEVEQQKAEVEQQKVKAEQQKAQAEQQAAQAEKDKGVLQEKIKEEKEKAEKVILNFHQLGISIVDIAKATGKTEVEVQKIIEKYQK